MTRDTATGTRGLQRRCRESKDLRQRGKEPWCSLETGTLRHRQELMQRPLVWAHSMGLCLLFQRDHRAKLCAGIERGRGRQGRKKKAGVKGSRGFSSHSKDLAFTMNEMEAT